MPLSSVNITLLLRNCFCDVFMIMISIITLETNLNNVLPSRLSSLARRNGGRHKKNKKKNRLYVCVWGWRTSLRPLWRDNIINLYASSPSWEKRTAGRPEPVPSMHMYAHTSSMHIFEGIIMVIMLHLDVQTMKSFKKGTKAVILKDNNLIVIDNFLLFWVISSCTALFPQGCVCLRVWRRERAPEKAVSRAKCNYR